MNNLKIYHIANEQSTWYLLGTLGRWSALMVLDPHIIRVVDTYDLLMNARRAITIHITPPGRLSCLWAIFSANLRLYDYRSTHYQILFKLVSHNALRNFICLPSHWHAADFGTTATEIYGILNIPLELRSAILRQLTRVEDVFSAIQSNKSLYEAFREDNTTVSYVFHRQIDVKLLPYAAAFLELDKTPRIIRHHKDFSLILEKSFSIPRSS